MEIRNLQAHIRNNIHERTFGPYIKEYMIDSQRASVMNFSEYIRRNIDASKYNLLIDCVIESYSTVAILLNESIESIYGNKVYSDKLFFTNDKIIEIMNGIKNVMNKYIPYYKILANLAATIDKDRLLRQKPLNANKNNEIEMKYRDFINNIYAFAESNVNSALQNLVNANRIYASRVNLRKKALDGNINNMEDRAYMNVDIINKMGELNEIVEEYVDKVKNLSSLKDGEYIYDNKNLGKDAFCESISSIFSVFLQHYKNALAYYNAQKDRIPNPRLRGDYIDLVEHMATIKDTLLEVYKDKCDGKDLEIDPEILTLENNMKVTKQKNYYIEKPDATSYKSLVLFLLGLIVVTIVTLGIALIIWALGVVAAYYILNKTNGKTINSLYSWFYVLAWSLI